MVFRARHLRFGLLLGTAFTAGAIAGPGLGLLHRALAQDSSRTDMYQFLKVFGDVFNGCGRNTSIRSSDKEVLENAINGMLTGLDPHSSYMNAKAFKDMQVQTKGEFGGLGLEVTEDKGLIKVVSPIDDTPAFRAGIKAGDIITALDGKTVIGLSLNDAVDRMRGAPNSKIVLTIKREGSRQAARDRRGARGHQDPGGEVADGAGQYRLYPPVAVHREGRRRHPRGGEGAEGAGRRPVAWR